LAHYAYRIINELKHHHIIKTMPKNNPKILAIDPGTREMGVAFLDGDKLIYHGVKVIPNEKSPTERLKEGKEIILRLINDFKPDILVVEKSFFANNRTASLLHTFINEIRTIGNKKGLKVVSYATSTVRKSIAGNGRASKKELSKVIVSKYPTLKVYMSQDRAWKELYHQNMFDAIALGLMALSLRDNGIKITK
jgi:Holliday junction resolvasome RuvABC endonuclease subunit